MDFVQLAILTMASICGICHTCKIHGILANCSNRGLSEVPEHLPPNIEMLDLSHNAIRILRNNTFLHYKNLISLNINFNFVQNIKSSAFAGLDKLVNLSMTYNKLDLAVSYEDGVFDFLISLQRLDIEKNILMTLNPKRIVYPYFGSLYNLTHLFIDLSFNPDFSYSGMKNLRDLRVVRFLNCFIRNLKNETFSQFPNNIQELFFQTDDYSNTLPIKIVEMGCLEHFVNLQVVSFICVQAKLEDMFQILYPLRNRAMKAIIYRKVGYTFTSSLILTNKMTQYLITICVKTLVLADLDIAYIETSSLYLFKDPSCFENIVLTGNKFALMDEHNLGNFIVMLSRVNNLKVFDYSYSPIKFNNIRYIPVPYFGNMLQRKTTIDRSNKSHTMGFQISKKPNREAVYYENDYQTLEGKPVLTISLPNTLHTLRLSYVLGSGIYRQHRFVFKNAAHLRHLDLSYYQLGIFEGISVDGPFNLEHLDISGISARYFVEGVPLPFLDSVKTLIMKNADLGEYLIRSNIIGDYFPSVEFLDISYNSIWRMNKNVFFKNERIKTLVLLNNILLQIPVALTYLQKLEHLDLRRNQIQSINESIGEWFDMLVERNKNGFSLKLDGNVFQCNCDTRGFIRWIFTTKAELDYERKNYTCRLSNGTNTDTLTVYREFHDLFGNCDSGTWLQIGLGCLFTLITLTIIAAVLFNFRWNISFWIYRKFKKVIKDKINLTFQYDIYLSYASDSVSWIKNVLLPTIEQSWKMRTCVEDRDFLGGHDQADTIAASINKSRHVVFIVSEGFTEREWRFFELTRARMEKYTKNLQKIVVIIKDTTSNNILTDFFNIWDDITIIEWSTVDASNGWNALRMTLFPETI